MKARAVTVIGIGADGCVSLSSRAVNAVARAQVLVGGARQLAFFPQFEGERLVIKGGFGTILERVAELAADRNVCVLASGDPLFFGIGQKVIEAVGREHVDVLPHPSSVQWAFARVGMAWDDAAFVSVHGRAMAGIVARTRRLRKVAILTDGENTPARIATHFLEYGDAAWGAWVCEDLGSEDERVRRFTPEALAACTDVRPLNVMLLDRPAGWVSPALLPYLVEDAFARRMPKKGLITKREVRALSIASLGLRPDSVVWDIGAGSGSVAIEAALLACEGRAYAVEVDPEGVAICRDNCRALGADNVTVVEGRAPEALEGLEAPDAVFVGGSKGSMEPIVEAALAALRPGGRLVVNAVTLENVAEAYRVLKARKLSPEITLLNASRGEPLAHYTRYEAMNPIHMFAVTAPSPDASTTTSASTEPS